MSWFERVRPILRKVEHPSWYVGGEVNQVVKDPGAVSGNVALVYPDTYEVGMSHYGLKILYHVVNSEPDLAAERCFAPWPDFGEALRSEGIPLYSLESHRPLREFDLLGFTVQSELTLTNILYCLDLAGIPLRAAERRDSDPIVAVGGHGSYAPEPLAEFVDLVVLGDGEETIVPLLREVAARRRDGQPRESMLRELVQRFPFLYAPALYEEQRGADGEYLGLTPRYSELPTRARSAYVFDLENAPFPTAPVVPHTNVIHDRISLEVMRGCVHGCRFCQAGMLTRPWRVRSPQKLLDLARESYRRTGIEEISLLSLSTSDYPYLPELVDALSAEFSDRAVQLSLPSLRVNDELTVVAKLPDQRKGGLTLAPEVATDRLRAMVNKPIKNEDLYRGTRQAFEQGYRHVKLYCMVGVPGEIESDLDGILEMGEECSRIGAEVKGRPAKVVVSCSTCVPKPFTPYQWDGMIPLEEIRARHEYLHTRKRSRSVQLRLHRPEESILEGALSRGDRRISRVVLRAYELGARFDGWSEKLRFDLWQQAFAELGIDLEQAACRRIPYDESLPWDHLDAGPAKSYLESESRRAREARATAHCFGESCNRCGVDAKDCFDLKHGIADMAVPKSSVTASG